MKSAVFYLLPDDDGQHVSLLQAACELAAQQCRSRQKVWVYCTDQQSAEQLDDLLWQRPTDAFVPHNLVGEGPANGAQVEIGWQAPQFVSRPVLINLHPNFPEFSAQFRSVIDFVPADEAGKVSARERYKQYRAAGFNMQTQPFEANIEKRNG